MGHTRFGRKKKMPVVKSHRSTPTTKQIGLPALIVTIIVRPCGPQNGIDLGLEVSRCALFAYKTFSPFIDKTGGGGSEVMLYIHVDGVLLKRAGAYIGFVNCSSFMFEVTSNDPYYF